MIAAASKKGQSLLVVIVMVFMIVPYEQIGSMLPVDGIESALEIVAKGVILSLLSMLAVSFWLWQQAAEQPVEGRIDSPGR